MFKKTALFKQIFQNGKKNMQINKYLIKFSDN